MKEYMLVTVLNGKQEAYFYDHASEADKFKMQIEAEGGYVQGYRLFQISDMSTDTPLWKEYRFVYD